MIKRKNRRFTRKIALKLHRSETAKVRSSPNAAKMMNNHERKRNTEPQLKEEEKTLRKVARGAKQLHRRYASGRIYEEDTKAHYKIRNERRNKGQQGRPKPYSAPGHKSNVCNGEEKKCFRCGKKGHTIAECKRGDIVCFNCDEEGHLSSQCKKPKKGQASGRVFALAGTQTANEDRLI
ncbi:uncharacterized protein C683.02c-like [Medicago truncatula]|uniref:uncharacterized protein C683.02c-like n=1 Tax=Medicago truncatula TaxID=3880 RepID=UPI00196729DD|nr:uncharacterized protein C683.02c-like [Medicago truncatula]